MSTRLISVFIASFVVLSSILLLYSDKLAYFFAFMVLATTVVPIYTPPVILYYGMHFHALTVGVVGGLASGLGCLLDYIIIGRVADTKYFSKYQETKFMDKTKKYFQQLFY